MKESLFVEIHNAADRVALEAARKASDEKQAEEYIDVYGKVSEYLMGEFEKADIDK